MQNVMKIGGKKLTGFKVVQPASVEDAAVVEAVVFRIEGQRHELTGERLAGSVPLRALIEWAHREGYLSWCDDPRNRGELDWVRR